ncbi:MAG: hypothetical protein ACJ786_19745 [Catenulispora sp.]
MEGWVEVTGGALVVVGFVVGGCTGPLADVGCGTGGCVLGRGPGWVEVAIGFGAALAERVGVTPGLPTDEEPTVGAPGPPGVPLLDAAEESATAGAACPGGAVPPGADPLSDAGVVAAAFAP